MVRSHLKMNTKVKIMRDYMKACLESYESKGLYTLMHFVGRPSLLKIIRFSAKQKAQLQEKLEKRYSLLLQVSLLSSQQDLTQIKVQLQSLKTLLLELNSELIFSQVDDLTKSNDT